MSDERIELICDSILETAKDDQEENDQNHDIRHCTQTPTLPSHQMHALIDLMISVKKKRAQLYSNNMDISRRDWNTVRGAFNKKFGGDTRVSVLECAIRREMHNYEIALFREQCRVAKEEDSELGERYWEFDTKYWYWDKYLLHAPKDCILSKWYRPIDLSHQ